MRVDQTQGKGACPNAVRGSAQCCWGNPQHPCQAWHHHERPGCI